MDSNNLREKESLYTIFWNYNYIKIYIYFCCIVNNKIYKF